MDRVSEHRKRQALQQNLLRVRRRQPDRLLSCGCRETTLTARDTRKQRTWEKGFRKGEPAAWAIPIMEVRRDCPVHGPEVGDA